MNDEQDIEVLGWQLAETEPASSLIHLTNWNVGVSVVRVLAKLIKLEITDPTNTGEDSVVDSLDFDITADFHTYTLVQENLELPDR